MRTTHGKFIRFTSLALVASAGTIAASAHGQQVVFDPSPEFNVAISTPTVAECSLAAAGFEAGTPQNVVMAGQLPAACGQVLADHLTATAASHPDRVHKMY